MNNLSDMEFKKIQQLAELYKCHLTLTRGAKHEYRWEISLRDNDDDNCIKRIIHIDKELIAKYGSMEE